MNMRVFLLLGIMVFIAQSAEKKKSAPPPRSTPAHNTVLPDKTIKAIPVGELPIPKAGEVFDENLCPQDTETLLWNIYGSRFAEEQRVSQKYDLLRYFQMQIRKIIAPHYTQKQNELRNSQAQKAGLDKEKQSIEDHKKNLNASLEGIHDFQSEMEKAIEGDFGKGLLDPTHKREENTPAGQMPRHEILLQSFNQHWDTTNRNAWLKAYAQSSYNFENEIDADKFANSFPRETSSLDHANAFYMFNNFLYKKYIPLLNHVEELSNNLNDPQSILNKKSSNPLKENARITSKGFHNALSALDEKSIYSDPTYLANYLTTENAKYQGLGLNLKAKVEELKTLSHQYPQKVNEQIIKAQKNIQDREDAFSAQINNQEKYMNSLDAQTLALAEKLSQMTISNTNSEMKMSDQISKLASEINGFIKDKNDTRCEGRAPIQETGEAKYYKVMSKNSVNDNLIELIKQAKELDPTCMDVVTHNKGGNPANADYRRYFALSFLNTYCYQSQENDTRFAHPKPYTGDTGEVGIREYRDALSIPKFDSHKIIDKTYDHMMGKSQNENLSPWPFPLHPLDSQLTGNKEPNEMPGSSLAATFGLLFSLSKRETGEGDFRVGSTGTGEIGPYEVSTNSYKLLSSASKSKVLASIKNFSKKINGKGAANYQELCLSEYLKGQIPSDSYTQLSKNTAKCQAVTSSTVSSCLSSLISYCPSFATEYQSFVVREGRDHHGPLLFPGDKEYLIHYTDDKGVKRTKGRPPNPAPSCTSMFTLLYMNQNYFCKNKDLLDIKQSK